MNLFPRRRQGLRTYPRDSTNADRQFNEAAASERAHHSQDG